MSALLSHDALFLKTAVAAVLSDGSVTMMRKYHFLSHWLVILVQNVKSKVFFLTFNKDVSVEVSRTF
jgi:hypothetical protein